MIDASAVWVGCEFAGSLVDRERCRILLAGIEDACTSSFTRFGTRDRPPRREQRTLEDLAQEALHFGPKEESTMIFGELADINGAITLSHRRVLHPLVAHYNQLSFVTTPKVPRARQVAAADHALLPMARTVAGFYGYADDAKMCTAKSPPAVVVHCNQHLLGVFWLTWFGPQYVEFFGRDRMLSLPYATEHPGGGVLLKLGDSPDTVPPGLRTEVEHFLGYKSFADPADPERKPPGKYVLTLDQLRESAPK